MAYQLSAKSKRLYRLYEHNNSFRPWFDRYQKHRKRYSHIAKLYEVSNSEDIKLFTYLPTLSSKLNKQKIDSLDPWMPFSAGCEETSTSQEVVEKATRGLLKKNNNDEECVDFASNFESVFLFLFRD